MAKTRARTALRPTLISLAVASCFTAGAALANPTGANVVRGTAAIHQAGNLLQITNSPNAIINWQSFSIGANEITRFIQQSASSAVLNRVTTQNPSTILGALQSNGRVFLINPNGILFGEGARIDVAGLVASSLNLSNEDFLAGRLRFTDVPGAGSVVNQGNITTGAGGSVYLVGSSVTNSGIITSPQGEVILAAGSSVELVSPGTPNLRVEIAATDHEARNLGQIISDAGRIGIYAGLINNSGTIRADSAVAEGGRIVLKATKSVTLETTSVLSAQGVGGGEIKVLADESVHVAGRLDASAPVSGDGGFIETSAAKVTFDPSVFVTTLAPNGKTGTWLVDPIDFTIDAAQWLIIDTALNTTNHTITTTGTQCLPGLCGTINITANSPDLATANNLQLVAHQNINVNGSVTNSGTGTLSMYAGWIETSGNLNPTVGFGGDINLNAPITLAGKAVLVAGGLIDQTASGAITAGSLFAKSNFNSVLLDSATNNVGTLAGDASGVFSFTNGPSLIIGSVDSGNTAFGIVAGVSSTSSNIVTINVTAGDLTVNNNILAEPGNSHNAQITLTALNNIIVNNSTIRSQTSPGEGDGNAFVTLTAQNGAITLNTSIVEAISTGPGCCGTDGNAALSMTAGGNMTLNSSSVTATGAVGDSGTPGGTASATLTAGGTLQLTASTVFAIGGDGGAGFGAGANGGSASVVLSAGGPLMVDGSINAVGGSGGAGGSGAAGGAGGSASISMNGGSISINCCTFATGGRGGNGGPASGGAGGNGGSGGAAAVTLSGGTIAVNGGSLFAGGGSGGFGGSGGSSGVSGVMGAGGAGTAVLAAGGNITVDGASVAAFGGSGDVGGAGSVTATAGAGGIVVQGGGGLICEFGCEVLPQLVDVKTLAVSRIGGSGIFAVGGGGATTGGAATVVLNTVGGITVDGTVVGAAGGGASVGTGGNALTMLTSGGNITLASIVTADGGLGLTNGTGRIDLIFLNSGTDFVVNGQAGLIFDTVTGSGFMVDGAAAILNVNMFVTGGGPAFIDPLVAAMNQQVDVLADQLKAGETGETEEEKKKLPFCSG